MKKADDDHTATLHVSGFPTEEGFGVRLGWTKIPWEENDDLVEFLLWEGIS